MKKTVMKSERLLRNLNDIDEKYILEALPQLPGCIISAQR